MTGVSYVLHEIALWMRSSFRFHERSLESGDKPSSIMSDEEIPITPKDDTGSAEPEVENVGENYGSEKDPAWKAPLRALRILSPDPEHETSDESCLRLLYWINFLLDIVVAITFCATSSISYCCDVPTLSLFLFDMHWELLVRIFTFVLLAMYILEFFTWWMSRPLHQLISVFGPLMAIFLLYATFMGYRPSTTFFVWTFISLGQFLRACTYRLLENKKRRRRRRRDDDVDDDDDDDDEDAQNNNILLVIGLNLNTLLCLFMLVLIIFVVVAGGVCITEPNRPTFFTTGDSLDSCPACDGVEGFCEICSADQSFQCHLPFANLF